MSSTERAEAGARTGSTSWAPRIGTYKKNLIGMAPSKAFRYSNKYFGQQYETRRQESLHIAPFIGGDPDDKDP